MGFKYWSTGYYRKPRGPIFTVGNVGGRTTEWLEEHVKPLLNDIRGCDSFIKATAPYTKDAAARVTRGNGHGGMSDSD